MKQRLRKRKYNPPLPSILLANVRSLRNKIDELHVNTKYLTEYRDSCLLCFSETWLTDNISNNALQVDGFYGPFRTDRDHDVTGKAIGGGVVYASMLMRNGVKKYKLEKASAQRISNYCVCHSDHTIFQGSLA